MTGQADHGVHTTTTSLLAPTRLAFLDGAYRRRESHDESGSSDDGLDCHFHRVGRSLDVVGGPCGGVLGCPCWVVFVVIGTLPYEEDNCEKEFAVGVKKLMRGRVAGRV